ncbi:O-methyltransferase [Thermoactinomyces mirandus]|uniref:O-methyltransferase n=1 Tax=Thermoactinomyces mirandus TaxID=2756294 RepID=A0A7W2ASC2_9BACL|nr:O-methyltransferase [Thermoactinomyces mirandus]MBA4603473.1 O-methyltransferase [Thermoactinomyces mirandus]
MLKKEYIRRWFTSEEDNILKGISADLIKRGLPQISVPPETGKLLYMLVRLSRAKNILEIGALGGYSTIWMAKALPEHGRICSLELNQEYIDFAEENVRRAGYAKQVRFVPGDAMESMKVLEAANLRFDFFFIDADKPNYIRYLEKAISLAQPGAIITADNLFQGGRIFSDQDQSVSTRTICRFNRQIASDERLESFIVPVGDGLGVCRVKKSRHS